MSLSDDVKEYYWGNGHHHIINLKLLQVKAKTNKKARREANNLSAP